MNNIKTTPSLQRGRRVYQGGYRGNGGGIVLAVAGHYDPNKEKLLGGFIHVTDASNDGHCDVVWPEGEHAHVSKQLPACILCSLPYVIEDEIADEAEIAAALVRVELANDENKVKAEAAVQAKAALKAGYIRDFGWLQKQDASISSHALGAKNLRKELGKAFPGIKFSVRSDCFAGGDSINVSWTLGPTTSEVQKITGKYREGDFDGMTDSYDYDHGNPWPDLFGGAKYVHCSRHEGESINAVALGLCDLWKLEKPADGKTFWNIQREGDNFDVGNSARQILFNESYPAGAVVTGVVRVEGVQAGSLTDFYRVSFMMPEAKQVPAEPALAAATVGVKITENQDKGGIEIRFPAKPDHAVLDSLKANGWRWSRFSSCWWHKASDQARQFAAQLTA